MDKSTIAKAMVILTVIYCIIAMTTIGCEFVYSDLYSSNYELARSFYKVGSAMAPFVTILIPFFMVPASIVLSIIGIIKSKKVLPYLLCPPIPVILWLITMATYARYI